MPRWIAAPHALRWSLFQWSGSAGWAALLFALGGAAALALIFGWRTRAATVAAWLWVVSVQHRDLHICDGGDVVLRVLCFWALFIDLGATWSLDVRLGRRPARAAIPALGVRLLQFQIAFIYVLAALNKTGATWHDGTALERTLRIAEFARPVGTWLTRAPAACRVLTVATLVMEWSFAPLALSPIATRRTRQLALALGLALHGGILLTMRVGLFSLVLPASYFAFLLPEWLDGARNLERGDRDRGELAPPARGGRRRTVLAFALGAQLLAALAIQDHGVLASRLPRLPLVRRELDLVGLWQNWDMFAPDPPAWGRQWEGAGVLQDGRSVDVLRAVAPGLLSERDFFGTRWNKYRVQISPMSAHALDALGVYLCRRWQRDAAPPPLVRLELTFAERDLRQPNSDRPPSRTVVLQHDCAE